MEKFEQVYQGLNEAQKLAVDNLYGPVLVVAGPGTGKTQLLSARVAQILRKTDALPQNILCLTFTESGVLAMRERLAKFIGSDAYDVEISTYHAFGSDLIRRYPEYFTETRLERPIDELGKRQLLADIIDKLSYSDPLKQTRWHLGDLLTTVSEVKRGLLSPDNLRAIAQENMQTIQNCSPAISDALRIHAKRLPTKLNVAAPIFKDILAALQTYAAESDNRETFESLAKLAANELERALFASEDTGKTKPLTSWKNNWLAKDEDNNYILSGRLEAMRIQSLADVLEAYETALDNRGLYDFDDMILRAIHALESHKDLQFTLQEQYQFILLDEFQDTNTAQAKLVELLCDNPVSEGRPNVLAVGDDDQAIYAFQGAQYSNMLDFFNRWSNPILVNLSENYRSTEPILATARNVAGQITDSLVSSLAGLNKQLIPAGEQKKPTDLAHTEYTSDVAERAGIATQIAKLVENGVNPNDIAILAPKHKYLEPLVPYLQDHKLYVSYEHRENILAAPAIRQLLTMSLLVLALHDRNQALADSLWPEVLSYEFWGHKVSDIWELSWAAHENQDPWSKLLLASEHFSDCALLFLALAAGATTEPLEIMLDRLIGTEEVTTGDTSKPTIRSPFRDFYAGSKTEPGDLYRVVTELAVLRSRLREHEQQRGEQLTLADLLGFVQQYEDADQQLLNTSPYNQAGDAVQLMTVFKAKGLEFEHVFILHAQNNVWGSSASDMGNKLTLPANLAPIRHAGTTEDERLRIFFVALTRAKHGLHLSSHRANYAGKQITRLRYLKEFEAADGTIESEVLPKTYAVVQEDDKQAPPLSAIEHDWRARHLRQDTTLKALLQDRLASYRLSPTHLTQFIDLEHAGPQAFLLQSMLKFPSAPSVDASFGNAMHSTLEWVQQQVNGHKKVPAMTSVHKQFSEFLTLQHIYGEQFALQEARGHHALSGFLKSPEATFTPGNKPEYNFHGEGVIIKDVVRMSGKIDLLEIDTAGKQATIVDYKTGSLGNNPAKLHRYELQLYCYKLLMQGSHSFANYTVDSGKLVFVEPGPNGGKIITKTVHFKPEELERIRRLVLAMWNCLQTLELPDTSAYGTSLTAIRQFEQYLIDKNI